MCVQCAKNKGNVSYYNDSIKNKYKLYYKTFCTELHYSIIIFTSSELMVPGLFPLHIFLRFRYHYGFTIFSSKKINEKENHCAKMTVHI